MANSDDVVRVLAECVNCGAAYAARQWPNGDIQPIGRDGCACGSAEFVVVDGLDDGTSSSGTNAE